MARSRNIKPGFFTNDALGEMEPLSRLLFAGLWVIADREGRLEDRPRKIRAEVMPYDDFDADKHLSSLEQAGFIARYESEGVKVIQVLAWGKHQNPHVKEAPSSLPEQCKHQTSTVQAPDKAQPLPAPAGLIPDSLLLIPDSLENQCTHTPLAREWKLPKAWGDEAMAEFPHWTPDAVRSIAAQFADHWRASGGSSADWSATWRKWCRDELTQKAHPTPKPAVAKPAAQSITVPCTDTRAEKHAADMEARKSDATLPAWSKKVAA